MLDRQKLLVQMSQISTQIGQEYDQQLALAATFWQAAVQNTDFLTLIRSKKWSSAVPLWHDDLGASALVKQQDHPYQVLAVDGSQIYYDRHQGPACYLVNIGSVFFDYGVEKSSCVFQSEPIVYSQTELGMTTDSINGQRDLLETERAVMQALTIQATSVSIPFVCLFDGNLINVSTGAGQEQQIAVMQKYFAYFEQLREQAVAYAGYVSATSSKDLVHLCEIAGAELLNVKQSLDRLLDRDIAQFFLAPFCRSTVFENKSWSSYVYPATIKPYFCYLNVGSEIVRLEFPAWIAKNILMLDMICAIAIDQVMKGAGYPVCLFEAHEQAVIKAADREFFYQMMQKLMIKENHLYHVSSKSMKKIAPNI
jgi:hypothetical protein